MGLATTIILYLVMGGAVSAAVLLREPTTSLASVVPGLFALLFWPLYVPGLLIRTDELPTAAVASGADLNPADELSTAIARVEAELDQALRSLDGWAETTLAAEQSRLDELKQTWRLQAARIRELDELLHDPAIEAELSLAGASSSHPTDFEPASRTIHTERSRRSNISRLKRVRQQLHDDLLASLAWVRELVTMIHLARYTGAPASRAEELVAQIAAAVEGLSAVSEWDDEPSEVA